VWNEDWVVISVTDDVAGLARRGRSRPVRSRAAARRRGGWSRLGLSIRQGHRRCHLGEIDLERLEHGTRFSVRLPIGGPDSSHRYTGDRDLSDV